MPKLLCFGDSITYGAWDTEGGWVARLRKKIDQECLRSDLEKFYLTYNLGISSDTSSHLLDRFDAEITAHMREGGEPMLIVSIGTNDSIRNISDGSLWVEPNTFKENIEALIEKARQCTDRILFIGSLPVNEKKTQPYITDSGISSSNKDIRAFEKISSDACTKAEVEFLPIPSDDYRKLLIFDGVHPNNAGHTLIADTVWKKINQLRWL